MNPGALIAGGRDVEAEQATLEKFAAVQTCPQVQVREGTEALRRYERGKQDDPAGLLYQATLRNFARECKPTGDGGTSIKVGVAGRLVAGPNGFAGTADLPLRFVLVMNGSEVLYSQVHPVQASVTPGQGSGPWTQVVEGIVVPPINDGSVYSVFVGFDEQAPTKG